MHRGPYVAHRLGWLSGFVEREPEVIDKMARRFAFYWEFFKGLDEAEQAKYVS